MIATLVKVAVGGFVIQVACFAGAAYLAGPITVPIEIGSGGDWSWATGSNESLGTGTKREITGFTGVGAHAGSRVEIEVGPEHSVTVTGDHPEEVVTRLSGSQLVIRPLSDDSWGGLIFSHHGGPGPLVRVTMPSVETLAVSTAAKISARGINAAQLGLEASTGSSLEVEGTCGALDAEASSGARVNAAKLACETGSAEASSGSRLSLDISKDLQVEASSGAHVEVSGDAHIGDVSLSSGAKLHRTK